MHWKVTCWHNQRWNTTRSVFGLQTRSPWQKLRITTNRSRRGSATDCRKNQLEILLKIPEIRPPAAYSAYMFRFKHKFTFFSRTLPDIADYLLPIEEKLRSRFIPAITGAHLCSDAERALLALPVKFRGLGLQNLCEVANIELLNSKEITRELYENVVKQTKDF